MSISQDHRIGTEVPVVTPGCDDEAIKVIEGLIKCIQQTKEFFDLRPDLSQKYCTSGSIPLSHDAIQAKKDTVAVLRAMPVFDVLKRGHDASQNISTWISNQFATINAHVSSLSLRAGFLSLPDEILTNILEFASYRQDEGVDDAIRNSVNAATNLSHVCSRFRTVSLAAVSLWNRISSSMTIDAISTCFERCGLAGVDIVLSKSPAGKDRDLLPFYQKIKQEIGLWRRFEHHLPVLMSSLDFRRLGEWKEETRDLETPLLTELIVRFPDSVPNVRKISQYQGLHGHGKALRIYSDWITPKLRSMEVDNLYPLAFPGARFLTDLTLKLDFRHHSRGISPMRTSEIATFLSMCQVLQKFSFTLRNCDLFDSTLSSDNPRVDMLTVINLSLKLSYCSRAAVEDFFGVIHFPEVRYMGIKCSWKDVQRNRDTPAPDKNIVDAVFSDRNSFPELIHLRLRVFVYGSRVANTENWEPNAPISIPFSNFLQLKCLDLTTWETVCKPLPEGTILPKLVELLFINCSWHELEWFVALYERVTMDNDLGKPVKLKINNCSWEHQWEEALESRRGRAGDVSDLTIEEEDGAEDNLG